MRPGLVSIGITRCHVRGLPGSYSIDHTDTVSSSGEQINYYILYSASGEYWPSTDLLVEGQIILVLP